MSAGVPVTIKILDKEFRVSCPEEERAELQASARYLNQKMKEVRDTGKVIGMDRIAIMAALNIAHDLLRCQERLREYDQVTAPQLRAVQERVRELLETNRQLEL
ncbi:MAG TPA: cell division protein ZapA [Gammaproteobacteria bacterium]|nr:cell division protein ZapA [Gammaproteobacteria bacterium]